MFRITKAETVLGGYTIPAGQLVVLVFSSANRDEAEFADGEDFDPERPNAKSHLAFGQGIHSCLGAALAPRRIVVTSELPRTPSGKVVRRLLRARELGFSMEDIRGLMGLGDGAAPLNLTFTSLVGQGTGTLNQFVGGNAAAIVTRVLAQRRLA